MRVSCMRHGMLTLSGAPSTTSHFGYTTSFHLDYNILSNLHYLGIVMLLTSVVHVSGEENLTKSFAFLLVAAGLGGCASPPFAG